MTVLMVMMKMMNIMKNECSLLVEKIPRNKDMQAWDSIKIPGCYPSSNEIKGGISVPVSSFIVGKITRIRNFLYNFGIL